MSTGSQIGFAYGGAPLPSGVRSRFIDNGNGLSMHTLEAGFETANRPCVLLLHGFPELAYSWRKVMPALAAAGFHVVAPDQRGYGRTTGWDGSYDGDVRSFRLLNLAKDALGLVSALDVGHGCDTRYGLRSARRRGAPVAAVAVSAGSTSPAVHPFGGSCILAPR